MRTYCANTFLRQKFSAITGCWRPRLLFAITACLILTFSGVSFGQSASGTPVLTASSSTVAFGSVITGQTVTRNITLTNTGTAAVTISSFPVAGSLFGASGLAAGETLQPGGATSMQVTFTPQVANPWNYTGTLTINSNAPTVTVNMTGAGIAATNPILTASVTSVAFGGVAIGKTASQNLTLTNTGTAPVTVSSFSVAGSLFGASGIAVGETLQPGGAVSMQVTFTPQVANPWNYTGTLTINSNAPTVTVNMTGAGIAATTPVSITTTALPSGTTGTAYSATLAATGGTAPYRWTSGTLPAGLALSTSGAISGSPTAASSSSVTFTVADSSSLAQTASVSLPLSIAAGTPGLKVNSTNINFGAVVIGQTATQSVTLTSTGGAPLTITSITSSGSLFPWSGPTLPLTLNSGQTATLNLKFAPTVANPWNYTSTVTIASNAPTVTISESGSGAARQIQLSWNAPASGSDPVAGYNIYRATSGSSSYQKLNSTVNSQTSFMDSSAQGSTTYQYYATSVDSTGAESVPSNTATVAVQ